MIEWMVTSSFLILVVMVLRFLLKGRIGLRLQYSLWLLVLLRLLIPFCVPSSLSIINIIPADKMPPQASQSASAPQLSAKPEWTLPSQLPQQSPQAQPAPLRSVSFSDILTGIWIVGMCATGLVLAGSNLCFTLRLKRSRTAVVLSHYPLAVYRAGPVATPCLFGLFHPSVYLSNTVTDGAALGHVLAHELNHYKHLDHIWSFLRCVCLVLHWYNPLVWAAAMLSRQDAELACDEATIRQLGPVQRYSYGHTLISLSCGKQDLNSLFLTATTMVGSKNTLKERIYMISKRPKTPVYALILIGLIVVSAAGCSFTGAKVEAPADAASEKVVTLSPFDKSPLVYNPEPYYLDDGIQACFVNVNGTVYIWDCLYNEEITQDILAGHATYFADVKHSDPNTMPEESLSACRLPVGTKLYTGTDIYANIRSQIVYCQPCPGSDDPNSFGRFIPEAYIHGSDRWWEKESYAATSMTMEELKEMVAEKGKLLYASDFEHYTQIRFGNHADYRIIPIENNYRLLLMFHRNPEVEVLHAKLYHVSSPETHINPLTDSIDHFITSQ